MHLRIAPGVALWLEVQVPKGGAFNQGVVLEKASRGSLGSLGKLEVAMF